jgi:hypothetical protein
MTAVVYNKRGKFAIKMAKNIAALPTEEQRADALLAVQEGSRQLVAAAVKAILRNREP